MGNQGKYFAAIIGAWMLVGCQNGNGLRGCLGGGQTCDPGTIVDQNGNNDTTGQTSSSNGGPTLITENAAPAFTCFAGASPSIVTPNQAFEVAVAGNGGAAGNKTVINYNGVASPVFGDTTVLAGSFDASFAGQVVTRTIQMRDANNNVASCAFSVLVAATNSNNVSPLNCLLSIDESVIRVGDTAHFSLRGFNASNATFRGFMPTTSQTAADSAIYKVDSGNSQAAVKYTSAGIKTASVRVYDGARAAFCSVTFSVGPTNLAVSQTPPGPTRTDGIYNISAQAMGIKTVVGSTYVFSSTDARAQITQTGANTARVKTTGTGDHTIEVKVTAMGSNGGTWTNTIPLVFKAAPTESTALTACSVTVATAGAWTDFSTLIPVSSTARVKAFPQGGVGPFALSILEVTSGGAAFGYTLQNGATDGWTQNLTFNATGTALVKARLTDAKTGQTADCSTYAVIQ